MYYINTHLYGKHNIKYPEDFPMLKNGQTFAMKKSSTSKDYIIQTIESDVDKVKAMIKTGERNITRQMQADRKKVIALLNKNDYMYCK